MVVPEVLPFVGWRGTFPSCLSVEIGRGCDVLSLTTSASGESILRSAGRLNSGAQSAWH